MVGSWSADLRKVTAVLPVKALRSMLSFPVSALLPIALSPARLYTVVVWDLRFKLVDASTIWIGTLQMVNKQDAVIKITEVAVSFFSHKLFIIGHNLAFMEWFGWAILTLEEAIPCVGVNAGRTLSGVEAVLVMTAGVAAFLRLGFSFMVNNNVKQGVIHNFKLM